MSVVIDFMLEAATIEEERRSNLLEISAVMLAFSHFEVPVRISIDGVEVLEWTGYDRNALNSLPEEERRRLLVAEHNVKSQSPPAWHVLALLNIAWIGTNAISRMATNDQFDFADHDSGVVLQFVRAAKTVRIHSSLNNRIAIGLYDDVVQAFQAFSRRVRDEVARTVPVLTEHPVVGDWFTGRVERPPLPTSYYF